MGTSNSGVWEALEAMKTGLGDKNLDTAFDDELPEDSIPSEVSDEKVSVPSESEAVAEPMEEGREEETKEADELDSSSKEEVAEEAKTEEAVTEEETEEDPYATIEQLRAELEERAYGQVGAIRAPVAETPPSPKEEAAPQSAGTEQQRREFKILPFLQSEEEYEAAVTSSDAMNKLLNRVYYTALQEIHSITPMVANSVVDQYFLAKAATDDFFKVNSDLQPYRKYMSAVVREVTNEHPNAPIPDVLAEAGKRVRKNLRLKAKAPSTAPGMVSKPGRAVRATKPGGFAPSSGSRAPQSGGAVRDSFRHELDEIQ